jgi:hypothetical protein
LTTLFILEHGQSAEIILMWMSFLRGNLRQKYKSERKEDYGCSSGYWSPMGR